MLSCYKALKSDESQAMPQRLAAATAELADVTERERELQETYARLVSELEDLKAGRVPAAAAPTAPAAEPSAMDLTD